MRWDHVRTAVVGVVTIVVAVTVMSWRPGPTLRSSLCYGRTVPTFDVFVAAAIVAPAPLVIASVPFVVVPMATVVAPTLFVVVPMTMVVAPAPFIVIATSFVVAPASRCFDGLALSLSIYLGMIGAPGPLRSLPAPTPTPAAPLLFFFLPL
ncbi:hypothetical protein BC938DRAFT_474143 [Jimgerdemannia flammicorona]|uniref:Uncharacterized protein n=1 Tax=Jimgerdemannia flammicorona TaxID=994334 RepID=A0A433QSV4_9FUNG|nr:hypothetical protein BC938DRAFT_474143 [Jimgerdemannia flammicorona]